MATGYLRPRGAANRNREGAAHGIGRAVEPRCQRVISVNVDDAGAKATAVNAEGVDRVEAARTVARSADGARDSVGEGEQAFVGIEDDVATRVPHAHAGRGSLQEVDHGYGM